MNSKLDAPRPGKPRLVGLTDKEIEEAIRRPYDKKAVFGPALEWLKRNRSILEREYAGMYVLAKAQNFTGVGAQNHDKAAELYNQKYGPTPPDGRAFIGQQF